MQKTSKSNRVQSRKFFSAKIAIAAASGVSGLLASTGLLKADVFTWNGSNVGNWTDVANWNGGNAPVSSDTTSLSFGGGTYLATNDFAGSFSLNNLTAGPSGSVSLVTGSAARVLSFGGTAPTLELTSGSMSVVSNLTFGDGMRVTNSGSGILTIGGTSASTMTYNGTTTFTNSGSGTLTVQDSAVYSGGATAVVNLANTGSGIMNIGNLAATFAGNVNITAGSVQFAGNTGGDLFGAATIVDVAAGASFNFASNGESMGGISGAGTVYLNGGYTGQAAGNRTFSGKFTGGSAVTHAGSGTFTLSGQSNFANTIAVGNGALVYASNPVTANNLMVAYDDTSLSGETLSYGAITSSAFSVRSLSITGGSVATDGQNRTMVNGVTVSGSGGVIVPAGSTFTWMGTTRGAGSLTLTGGGTWRVAGSTAFTGTVNVNQGELQLTDISDGSFHTSGDLNAVAINVNSGGKFTFGNYPKYFAENSDLPNTTAITVNTGGELVWNEGENFGGIILNGGRIQIRENVNVDGAFPSDLRSGTIAFVAGASVAPVIGGSAAIVKTTPGTVNITGIPLNSTGGLTISEGSLVTDSGFTSAGLLTIGGASNVATLDYTGGDRTISKAVSLAAGGGVISVANSSTNVILASSVDGAGALVKTGAGALTVPTQLDNYNHSGSLTASQGTLRVAPYTGTLAHAGNSTAVSDGAVFAIAYDAVPATYNAPSLALGTTGGLSGATIRFDLNSSTSAVPLLQIGNADALTQVGSADTTLQVSDQTALDYPSTIALIKYVGSPITSGYVLGTLPGRTVGGLVYDTANSQISLAISGNDTLKWVGNVNSDWDTGSAVNVGGTFNWKLASNNAATNFIATDIVTFDDSAANFSVNPVGTVSPGSVVVNNSTNAYNFTSTAPSSIAVSTGFTKQGTNSLTLNNVSLDVGTTLDVQDGTLNLGTGNHTAGTLKLTSGTISGTGTTTANTYLVQNGTVLANLAGVGSALSKTTSGTVVMASPSSTYGGATTLSAGTLTYAADPITAATTSGVARGAVLGGPIGTGQLIFDSGTLNASGVRTIANAIAINGTTASPSSVVVDGASQFTWSGALSGIGQLNKTGDGQLRIVGAGTGYTGTINVLGGELLLSDVTENGLGNTAGDLNASLINVYSGAKFTFGTFPAFVGENPDLPDTTYISAEAGSTVVWNIGENFGGIHLHDGVITQHAGMTINGTTPSDWTNGTIGADGGIAAIGGTASIAKTSGGTVTITGVSLNNSGNIGVDNGLLITNSGISSAGSLSFGAAGTTPTAGTLNYTGASASIARPVTLNGGGGVIDLPAGTTVGLTGTVSGSGPLIKKGSGVLVATNISAFTGASSVNAGLLRIAPHSSAGITVADGASLAVAYGAAIASLTAPTVTFGSTAGGANVALELQSSTITAPLVDVTGVDGLQLLGGTPTNLIVLNTSVFSTPQTVTLFDYNGAPITSGFNLILQGHAAGALVYDTANTKINLELLDTGALKWKGNTDNNWDMGTSAGVGGTTNWIVASTNAATNFVNDDTVIFDDTALSHTVNLAQNVTPATVIVDTASTYTFQAGGGTFVTASGGFTKKGTGALNLVGAGLIVNSALVVEQGDLDLGTAAHTAGNFTVIDGNVAGTGTITANSYVMQNGSVSVAMLGATSPLTKSGTGTVTLSGTSSYGAGTAMNAGVLVYAGDVVSATAKQGYPTGAITSSPLGKGVLALAGGTLQADINNRTIVNGIAVTAPDVAPATIAVASGETLNLTGSTSGTGTLEKTGAGMLRIMGGSSWSGKMNIRSGEVLLTDTIDPVTGATGGDLSCTSINIFNGGKFSFGSNPAYVGENPDIASACAFTVNTGGQLDWNVGEQIGMIHMNGGTVSLTAGPTLNTYTSVFSSGTIVSGNGTQAIGTVSGQLPIIVKTTSGTVTLTGVNLNTNGGLRIEDGILSTDSSFVTTGTMTFGTAGATPTTGTLQYTGGGITLAKPTALADGGGVIDITNPAATYALSSSVVGTGPITKTGPGTLTLSGTRTYTGPTNVNAGLLNLNGTYNPTVASTTTLNVASAANAVVGGTASFYTVSSPSSDLTVNGTLNIQSSSTTDVSMLKSLVGPGRVTVDKGALNTAAGPRVGTLDLTGGAVVTIGATDGDGAGLGIRGSIAGVTKVASLSIDATSKLDLKNNGLIIPAAGNLNGSAITVDTLRAAIIAGRGGVGTGAATWSGAGGIGTSVFAFDETFDSIGYCWTGDPNLLVGPTDVNGESYDAGDYVVKYCAGADADLNGLVDDTDVAVIGLTYDGGASTGHHWYEGDFNYDGLINDDDVAIIGLAYNPGATPLSPSFQAALSAEYGSSFASAFAFGASTVVPEPTSLGLLAVGAMGLLRRRK